MLNVIVPLDFSKPSFNAALYAANMFSGIPNVTMILYHFYKDGEDTTNAKEFLISQQEELGSLVNNIETVLESGNNFIDSFAAFTQIKRAYMVVMGLTGKTALEQRFSGSNTLSMSEKDICPVLAVPEEAVYKGISNALITSEMKTGRETPTLLAVKKVLLLFKPSLHILNVNADLYISLTEEIKEKRDNMELLLAEFNPEFYFMRLYDFHEAVEAFVKDKNIDVIIIAPKYHSFFEKLFKTQNTKKLIYQTSIPVLLVHD